ncbi:MAG: Uma2 family endonuclease [Sphingomonadaceae bacterium]
MTIAMPVNVQQAVKLRVDDFMLLCEHGAFVDYGKVELIHGEIFALNAQFRPHLRAKKFFYDELRDALRATDPNLTVFTEGFVALSPDSMPEPDVIVTDQPDGGGPLPAVSVKLVVEIADTTAAFDLGPKRALYAQHGLAEYWVVDLNARCVHQMWSPGDDGFGQGQTVAFGSALTAFHLDGLTIQLPEKF